MMAVALSGGIQVQSFVHETTRWASASSLARGFEGSRCWNYARVQGRSVRATGRAGGYLDHRAHSGRIAWQASAASSSNELSSESEKNQDSSCAYINRTPRQLMEGSFFSSSVSNKGWDDSQTIALLRSLAVIAAERSDMHGILAIQRDNWTKLLQVTVTMSMISAGVLSAINSGTESVFNLSFPASLLASGALMFMTFENYVGPAQLAEEQRAAARFFKGAGKEIESHLRVGSGSQLKEDAHVYYQAKLEKLRALDKAFPLTLQPGLMNKYTQEIIPPLLSPEVDLSFPELPPSPNASNGWTSAVVGDLKAASVLMQKTDIKVYKSWATATANVNKVWAISAPALAFVSVVANFVQGGAAMAASCSIIAALASSFFHDAQGGMIVELYRTVAGVFEDLDNLIQRNLRLPVELREDGRLFHARVALQLGRKEGELIVASDDEQTAGKIF